MSGSLWFLLGLSLGAAWRAASWYAQADHDARQRRVGWAYGYGAGVVDGKHGRYDPTAPLDGRLRDPVTPQDQENA